MILDIERVVPNAAFSLYRYLRQDCQYKVGATQGRLIEHFQNLQFTEAYPSDLTKLTQPTLAIQTLQALTSRTPFYGLALSDDTISIPIYGFVMGREHDRANVLYRDRLINDLIQILLNANLDGVIPLYEQASKLVIGHLEISDASATTIPVNVPEIEADRFKFRVDVTVGYSVETRASL